MVFIMMLSCSGLFCYKGVWSIANGDALPGIHRNFRIRQRQLGGNVDDADAVIVVEEREDLRSQKAMLPLELAYRDDGEISQ